MITINNIYKLYNSNTVLDSFTTKFERGTINYLVGPNGAGKTTLIKILLGLVKPTSGDIYFEDQKLNGSFSYRKKIGYMPQYANFPENLTVREVIYLIKNIRSDEKNYDEELIDLLGLGKEFNKRISNLSGGNKQKVSAVIAFLFNPEVLILDEPTSGLDPVSSSFLKDKILKENKNGKTIIFTSHILSELEELAKNVIFVLDGKKAFDGQIEFLIKSTSTKNLERAIAQIMQNGVNENVV